ncbi:DUF3502 domain-containing protein [Streptococcus sp. 1343]
MARFLFHFIIFDPDKAIPELMEKLKSEGAYETVLNEMQKQYDEFLKNKK